MLMLEVGKSSVAIKSGDTKDMFDVGLDQIANVCWIRSNC
jgi:hypothetical protein